jgi:hypothetical protein
VSAHCNSFQYGNQLFEFCVVFVTVPSFDVNAVLLLPAEILFEVVDYYGAFDGAAQTSQIFDVVSLAGEVILQMDRMLTIESVGNQTLCVEAVKNFVGVLNKILRNGRETYRLVCGGEDHDFVVAAEFEQEMGGVRSYLVHNFRN